MYIFEKKDKTGRVIYLTQERWSHILKHPEMQDSLAQIERTLIFPQRITFHKYDESIRNYYYFLKEKKRFLKLLVKYLNGRGFLITAYLVENIR